MKLLVLRIILHTINFFYLVVRRAHTEIWIKINSSIQYTFRHIFIQDASSDKKKNFIFYSVTYVQYRCDIRQIIKFKKTCR